MINRMSEIRELVAETQLVANIEPNERFKQDSDDIIIDKYPAPESYFSVAFQACSRSGITGEQQSTDRAIKRIVSILDEIDILIKTPLSNYDFYANFFERVESYKALSINLNSMSTHGIPNIKETSKKSSSRMKRIPIETQQKREADLHRSITTIESISDTLRSKIHDYDEIIKTNEVKGLPEYNVHIKELLNLLIFPDKKIDWQYANLETYKNLPLSIVKEQLIESYGENVVEEILGYYELSQSRRISYSDLQALVIGIVANLTQEDLYEISKRKKGIAFKSICDETRSVKLDSVRDFFNTLLRLRNINLDLIENLENKPYLKQLQRDLAFLESCTNINHYNFRASTSFRTSKGQDLKQFGYTEHLACDYVYSLFSKVDCKFREGTLLTFIDSKGNLLCKRAYCIDNDDDLYAFGLINLKGLTSEHDSVQIVFRGSYDGDPLQQTSPGTLNFPTSNLFGLISSQPDDPYEKKYTATIRGIHYLLNKSGSKKATLELIGHDIGAENAQLVLANILKEIKDSSPLRKSLLKNSNEIEAGKNIRELNMYLYDPKPINKEIALDFFTNLIELEKIFPLHLRYFSKSETHPKTDQKCFLGLNSSDTCFPAILDVSWFQLDYFYNGKHKTSLEEYCSDTRTKLLLKKKSFTLARGISPIFSDINPYVKSSYNPASVKYYCTTSVRDPKLINSGQKGNCVKPAFLHKVLTPGFSYPEFLRKIDYSLPNE
ncbi:MAG: hypothetical protein VX777_01840 [Chlamydiota bacterium]|nr:hypothetical protein [Chlamydiota bacterium]